MESRIHAASMVILTIFTSAAEGLACDFRDYLFTCHLLIGNRYAAQITAIVNGCHDPVDVTFNIKAPDYKVSWSHTFVNQHEMLQISGFPRNVVLHVFVGAKKKNYVRIKAEFHIDGKEEPVFLNSTVHVSRTGTCGILNGAAGLTTLVIFIVIILCLFIVVPTIIWYKRRQHIRMRDALVDNMEPSSQCPPSSVEMRQTPLGAIEESTSGEHLAEREDSGPSNGSIPSTRDIVGQERSFDLSNGIGAITNGISSITNQVL